MKIPTWLASIIVTVAFALEGWTLQQVVQLREDVAAINAKLEIVRSDPPTPNVAMRTGR